MTFCYGTRLDWKPVTPCVYLHTRGHTRRCDPGGVGELMHGAKIEIFELPFGQDVVWFPEWNTVAFAPHLDVIGRERALDRLQVEWRNALALSEPAA